MRRSWRPLAAALVGLGLAAPVALGASPSPASHHGGTMAELSSPAAELRVDLDRLLAEHAFLTIEQMRSGLIGAPDFAAAAAAVERNSTDVAEAIGSIYGDAAAEPFGEIWRSHIAYLVDYAVALGKGDSAAQQTALEGLAEYRQDLKQFLGDANPGVDLADISDALDMHTAQLVEFVLAVNRGDHAAAYAIEREAYPHMFEVGDALAKVIANKYPDRFTGLDVAYSAAGSLRITLDRLLGEHAFLAAEAMRSGVSGAPDFDAGREAIDGNASDLAAVVAAAYGEGAGAAFRTVWDGHITGYYAYIEATRSNDNEARAGATAQVEQYVDQLVTFLTDANPELDAGALAALLKDHVGHLTGQVEAFAASDYDRTYDLVREGYQHMFMAGEALAIGIATQMPDKFPDDVAVPDTGTDPHAGHDGPPNQAMIVDALALVLGLLLAAGVGLGTAWRLQRGRSGAG
jgi:hypothetical protein